MKLRMKMAKASKEEWDKVVAFAQELADEQDYPRMTNEELGKWARNAPPLFRVVFGFMVLVDNCCDPNADTLEWKPEITAAIAAYKQPDSPITPCSPISHET
jgi:hypothetical protein